MSYEKYIGEFKDWAVNLGLSPDIIPNDETLKLIFRSRQCILFQNLQEKIISAKKIDNIRNNIFISKMEKLKDIPLLSRSTISSLPKEMQRYEKIRKLDKRIVESELKINDYEMDILNYKKKLKQKNIYKMELLQREDALTTKNSLYKGKYIILKNSIEKEKKIEFKLNKIMPIPYKINCEFNNTSRIDNTIKSCKEKIVSFYDAYLVETNVCKINSAKEDLWQNLNEIIYDIPNILLFNELKTNLEQNLKDITTINDNKFENGQIFDNGFKLGLAKAYAYHIKRDLDIKTTRKSQNKEQENYCQSFVKFTESLSTRLKLLFSDTLDGEEILNKYIEQYSLKLYHEGQIEYGLNEIEKLKEKVNANKYIMEEHESLIDKTNTVYSDIETLVIRIKDEILQLKQIKEKMNYVKSLTSYSLHDINKMKNNNLCKNNGTIMNNSNNSFGPIKDNVLCSTKIDFDCSAISTDTTVFSNQNKIDNNQVPLNLSNYANEIAIFAEIPFSKFGPNIKNFEDFKTFFDVTTKIDKSNFLEELPGYLLTVAGVLKDTKVTYNFHKKIQQLKKPITTNIEFHEVDDVKIEKRSFEQNKNINELFDAISILNIKTKEKIKQIKKYYEFLLNNPLKKYIASSNVYNGRQYHELEAEYMVYYRIIKGVTNI